jgi:cyclopropane fatty-acyl-phospholipid synthase-like methyltransferase
MASEFFKVHVGNFPDLEFNDKYDVIIFRGCIEHVGDPLKYLEKAKDILNEDGVIFFTATPNRDSFTCDLFKEKWNMHYPFEHLYHFSPVDLINFYKTKGLKSFSEKNIYLNSPYINIKNDLSLVLKKLNGEDVICPPFFDNMLTLVLLF